MLVYMLNINMCGAASLIIYDYNFKSTPAVDLDTCNRDNVSIDIVRIVRLPTCCVYKAAFAHFYKIICLWRPCSTSCLVSARWVVLHHWICSIKAFVVLSIYEAATYGDEWHLPASSWERWSTIGVHLYISPYEQALPLYYIFISWQGNL